jgi:uncharacterized membrane protein YkoI
MNGKTRALIAVIGVGLILGLGAIGASANGGQTTASVNPSNVISSARSHMVDLASSLGIGEDEGQVAPGTLDDGKDLLPQSKITIDQAIEAAEGAEDGSVGEVDLEHFDGRLVFNVDIGDKDVKVDAANGSVLGSQSDD